MTNQYKVLSSTMTAFDVALQTYDDSLQASGMTMKQNSIYMQSLQSRLTLLKAEFQKLVIGDGGLQDVAKSLVSVGTIALKVANTDISKVIISFGLLYASINAIGSTGILTSLFSSFGLLTNVLFEVTAGTLTFNEALFALNINPTVLAITALCTVLSIGVKYYKDYSKRVSETKEEVKGLKDEVEKLHKAEEEGRITEAQKQQLKFDEIRLEILEKILEKQRLIASGGGTASTYLTGGTTQTSSYASSSGAMAQGNIQTQPTSLPQEQTQKVEDIIDVYKRLKEELENTNAESYRELDIWDKKKEKFDQIQDELVEELEALKKKEEQTGIVDSIDRKRINTLEDLIGAYADEKSARNELIDIEEEESEYIDSMSDKLKDLKNSYSTLESVVTEYNKTGQLTLDSLSELLSLDSEYLDLLQVQNGVISVSKDKVIEKANALVEERKAQILQTAYEKLEALQSKETQEATSNLTSTTQEDTTATLENANAQLADAVAIKYRQLVADESSEDIKSQAEEIYSQMQAEIKLLDGLVIGIDKVGSASSSTSRTVKSASEEMLSSFEKLIKEQKSQLSDYLSDLKKEKSNVISAIKDERDARLKSIDKQLKALKSQRDAEKKVWDERINAFKKQREELEKQNKLMELQEALAKAKSSKVLAIGESGRFEYAEDEAQVSKAEQDLYDYQQQQAYEEELARMEAQRDSALAYYDKRIEDLEDYRDRVQEKYDEEIEAQEKHYDELIANTEKMINDFELQAERLLNDQLGQVDSENQTYKDRLKNLQDFINDYNTMLKSLNRAGVTVSSHYKGISSTSTKTSIAKTKQANIGTHADGIPKINNEDISIVGENPNKEIVLGSKINNGIAMHLSSGSGVVNAKSTSTLAGLLNMFGDYARNNFGAGNGVLTNNTTSNSTRIEIGNISLPEVKDGKGFVDYLQNFSLDMKQKAFA